MAKPPRIDRRKKRELVDRKKVREIRVREPTKRPGGSNTGNLITRRRKNSSVRPGMQLGDLYIVSRVATKKGSSGGQKWRAECSTVVFSAQGVPKEALWLPDQSPRNQ
jgi:hypothetical protein